MKKFPPLKLVISIQRPISSTKRHTGRRMDSQACRQARKVGRAVGQQGRQVSREGRVVGNAGQQGKQIGRKETSGQGKETVGQRKVLRSTAVCPWQAGAGGFSTNHYCLVDG